MDDVFMHTTLKSQPLLLFLGFVCQHFSHIHGSTQRNAQSRNWQWVSFTHIHIHVLTDVRMHAYTHVHTHVRSVPTLWQDRDDWASSLDEWTETSVTLQTH